MKRVLIYGTSNGAKQVLELLNWSNVKVMFFVDSNVNRKGEKFERVKIVTPKDITKIDYDYIIIGSITYEKEMIKELLHIGIEQNLILTPLSKIKMKNKKIKYFKKINEKFSIYKCIFTRDYTESVFNDVAFCSMNSQYSSERSIFLYDYPDYLLNGIDYVRLSTVESLAKEIEENKVYGSIAELGVYQGNFTKLLSSLFTNRTLYLFDTFEGFSREDLVVEKENNYSNAVEGHLNDTNINIVLNKINRNQKEIIIKKGYFPDTTKDVEEDTFAFVSIDVDLYKPTYDGLVYFYRRLSKGGYIIVHDYNFPTYSGVKEAVREFSKKYDVSYVPVSDYFGSVIITK